ncbi:MAG: acyl-CoA thioesterase [Treponema sp.]|jgi:acyl-CoA thioester hydrolase|nr:acyl-CoA thioesterase [Treponema sp.]
MFSIKISPRFGDIDALGHVNNTVLPIWFETGRTPVIQIFDTELALDRKTFPLIMAHTDLDFLSQIYFKYEVEIRTSISKIGTKSFTVHQEAWQQGNLCAKGNCVIVYFDFNANQTAPLPEDKKKLLSEHISVNS